MLTYSGENAESVAEPRVSDPKPIAACHCRYTTCLFTSPICVRCIRIAVAEIIETRTRESLFSNDVHANALQRTLLVISTSSLVVFTSQWSQNSSESATRAVSQGAMQDSLQSEAIHCSSSSLNLRALPLRVLQLKSC